MNKLRGLVVALSPAGIFLLAGLSGFSACLRSDGARDFFNSIPLTVFWLALLTGLFASLIVCRSLRRNAWMLAIHIGLGLVIVGAMWGSDRAHELRKLWLGQDKLPAGQVKLAPGDSARLGELTLKLAAARVDYYPPKEPRWRFYFETFSQAGKIISRTDIHTQPGRAVELGGSGIRLQLLGYIEQNPTRCRNGLLPPPVVKLELSREGVIGELAIAARENSLRETLPLMLFDTEQAWVRAGRPTLVMSPAQAVRRYQATVVVSDEDGGCARKTIEVNQPMHFGGYHFYLASSDPTGRDVTIMVRSDSGLMMVYVGLGLLLAGLIGRLWLGPVWRRISKISQCDGRREAGDGD
jgi:hypothetical protein